MKVLIVSDTHGRDENLKKVVEMTEPFDCMIHLGDVEGSEEYIRGMVSCPVRMVSGNNDFFSELPRELEFEIGKYRVLITHGHYYYVSLNTDEIRRQARTRGIDIVMFGHTHKPYLDQKNGITVLNPGSLSYPRQSGRCPSYIWMELDEKGEAHYDIRFLSNRSAMRS